MIFSNQFLRIVVQTIFIYLLLVISLRLFGKKELAQLSIIDLVFILLISNSVQNAMVGSMTDFIGGIFSAGALFLVNFGFKKLLFHNKKISNLIEGEPVTLIYKGNINEKNLDAVDISMNELEVAIREHGVQSVDKVDLAVLEIDGNISVLSNDFTHRTVRKRRVHKVIKKEE